MVFVTIIFGLLPSFLMVILGGVLRPRLSANAWQGLDKLNFEILFPALIFVAASSRPLSPSDLLGIGPAVWLILSAGLVLGYLARPFGPERFRDYAGAWQTAWRFNTAMGFVAITTIVGAPAGILAVAVGMAIPVANMFAVLALSRGAGSWKSTFVKIITNPFLIASLAGVAVGLTGLKIHPVLMAPLEMLSRAAIPIALISVGATMNWGALARLNRFSAIIVGTKLIALPALTFIVCFVLDVETLLASTLVLFAALPTATAAHVLASGFAADREFAATLVAQSTLLSAATLPLWITAVTLLL